MATPSHYTVTQSFITSITGEEREYNEGEVIEASDPVLKKFPELFAPIVAREVVGRPVEQATAAPGEKRGKAMTVAGMKG